jgi:hypothetical protein
MEHRGLREAIAQGHRLWADLSQLLIIVSGRRRAGGGSGGKEVRPRGKSRRKIRDRDWHPD